jgi:hypothetical protein
MYGQVTVLGPTVEVPNFFRTGKWLWLPLLGEILAEFPG